MVTYYPQASSQFTGFQSPTYTPVPDEVFDVLAPKLTESELRVLLYVVRRTFGFHKNSDAISLTQLVRGIQTKEGKVLDAGTGMSRSAVARGVKGLVKKGILNVKKAVSPDGDNETNVYSLRFKDEDVPEKNEGVVLQKNHPSSLEEPGVVSQENQGVVLQKNPQQIVLQQTVRQETVVGGVVGALTEFGISEKAATQIATKHEEAYILEKIEQVQWLMENQPEAVAKNPAGYLRRAIEENFTPPTGYHRQDIRAQGEEQDVLAREERDPETPEPSPQAPMPILASTDAKDNPWQQALERIKERQLVTRTVFATWLRDTRLVSMDGETASIGFANPWIAQQVERQLYTVITQALAEVTGRALAVQFSALQEQEGASKAA